MRVISAATAILSAIGLAQAHSGHEIPKAAPDADWATRHMVEEHHISQFDAGAFFTLHDYDSSREWTHDDIKKTYGLYHESTKHISDADKDRAVRQVISLYDKDNSGTISFTEFKDASSHGVKLPDFGYGPGHHGDDEYEYEIHHFELFHDENTREEDLTHPEDIEHFRHHEMLEEQEERQEQMDKLHIIEANIPAKFRRNG